MQIYLEGFFGFISAFSVMFWQLEPKSGLTQPEFFEFDLFFVRQEVDSLSF